MNAKLAEGKKLIFALSDAHDEIQVYSNKQGYKYEKPATTIVSAVIIGDKMQFVWEGDSMGFVVRDGKIIEAVLPDSKAQELKAKGKYYRNNPTVLKRLGGKGAPERPSVGKMITIQDGDWIVIGSDGMFADLGLTVVPQNKDKTIDYEKLNQEAKIFLKMFGPIDNAKELGMVLKEWIEGQGLDDATYMGLIVEKRN